MYTYYHVRIYVCVCTLSECGDDEIKFISSEALVVGVCKNMCAYIVHIFIFERVYMYNHTYTHTYTHTCIHTRLQSVPSTLTHIYMHFTGYMHGHGENLHTIAIRAVSRYRAP